MPKRMYQTLLENATERAVRDLSVHEIGSEEYGKTLDRVVTLHKMVAEDKPSSMSKDTMAVVGTNLLGIIMILAHEWTGPVTSKALSLIIKPRI